MKNKFITAIKLRDVKDQTQKFKLQVRNDAALYTVQTHKKETVIITAVVSGITKTLSGSTIVWIEKK
jgi:hypothetical protein